MTTHLDQQLALLRTKVIVSNERINLALDQMEAEIALLGVTTFAKPEVNDVMFQILYKLEEEKRKIVQLKRQLTRGGSVPPILLEMFNISYIANPTTLRHSLVQSYSIADNKLTARVALLNISSDVVVYRADPFTYQEVTDEGLQCLFHYTGPELVLYNITSDCARSLIPEEVSDEIVMMEGCRHRKVLPERKNFEPIDCKPPSRENITRPRIQMKHDGHKLKINCQGHSLTIGNEVKLCPNHIFSVQEETSFVIDGNIYKHTRSTIKKVTPDFAIPDRLNLQIGASRSEFRALTDTDVKELELSHDNNKLEEIKKNLLAKEPESDLLSNMFKLSIPIGSYLAWGLAAILIFM